MNKSFAYLFSKDFKEKAFANMIYFIETIGYFANHPELLSDEIVFPD